MWNHVKRLFWINYSRPHRKLVIQYKEGWQSLPNRQRKLNTSHVKTQPEQRPSRKLLVDPRLLHPNSRLITECITQRSVASVDVHLLQQIRQLHTTARRQVPPILWAVLKPIGKVWAMLWGRYIRRWWAAMPVHKRTEYKNLFGGMKGIILGVVAFLLVGCTVNYLIHLQENPFTGRLRFISLSNDQIKTIAQWEEETYAKQYEDKLLPLKDPQFQRVVRCSMRLLKANQGCCDKLKENHVWKISVIKDDDINNAFVLPTCHIFVFTGLLKEMANDDQLAVILGHEIAHACMDHAVEHISRAQILDFFMIAALAAIWTFVPGDGIAIITQWFYSKLTKLMMELPYSRELELEADEVGLTFAARACYDIREAPALWAWQEALGQFGERATIPEFLSTHPAHRNRTAKLEQLLPKAEEHRKAVGCPQMNIKLDPRLRVQKAIEDLKSKAHAQLLASQHPISGQ